jgi:hypothetical protein
MKAEERTRPRSNRASTPVKCGQRRCVARRQNLHTSPRRGGDARDGLRGAGLRPCEAASEIVRSPDPRLCHALLQEKYPLTRNAPEKAQAVLRGGQPSNALQPGSIGISAYPSPERGRNSPDWPRSGPVAFSVVFQVRRHRRRSAGVRRLSWHRAAALGLWPTDPVRG